MRKEEVFECPGALGHPEAQWMTVLELPARREFDSMDAGKTFKLNECVKLVFKEDSTKDKPTLAHIKKLYEDTTHGLAMKEVLHLVYEPLTFRREEWVDIHLSSVRSITIASAADKKKSKEAESTMVTELVRSHLHLIPKQGGTLLAQAQPWIHAPPSHLPACRRQVFSNQSKLKINGNIETWKPGHGGVQTKITTKDSVKEIIIESRNSKQQTQSDKYLAVRLEVTFKPPPGSVISEPQPRRPHAGGSSSGGGSSNRLNTPPGWWETSTTSEAGRVIKTHHAPNGSDTSRSVVGAWRMHDQEHADGSEPAEGGTMMPLQEKNVKGQYT